MKRYYKIIRKSTFANLKIEMTILELKKIEDSFCDLGM